MWWLAVPIGASLREARDAVARAGVTDAVEADAPHEYGSDSELCCTFAGFDVRIRVSDLYNAVDQVFATRKVARVEDTFAVLREAARVLGPAKRLQLLTRAVRRDEVHDWFFETAATNLEVRISRVGDEPWQVDTFATQAHGSSVATLPLGEVAGRLEAMRRDLAATPASTGERAGAVARWLELARFRCEALARFVDHASRETPACPFAAHSLTDLEQHVRWVAHHHELFAEPDDWCDVLAVHPIRFDLLGEATMNLGWQRTNARIGPRDAQRDVDLVVGPFAAGVERTKGADELYPLRGDLPIQDVAIETLPAEKSFKMKPRTVIATLGDTRVELSGFGDQLQLVARLLAAARERRR